jgi:ABC-type polar amino acid transport system ATPase subunit
MVAALAALDASCARVSVDLPLRANLTAADNIALIPLYQRGVGAARAAQEAAGLLDTLGAHAYAGLRDPDMDGSQRFVTKLARALILRRTRLVIDTPAALLPDVCYPVFLRALAARTDGAAWDVYDYAWNEALWHA